MLLDADVVPVPVVEDEDVDRVVVVVEAELPLPPFVVEDDNDVVPPVEEFGGPAVPGVGGAGAELEEFSSRSCCTCRMSTYSSRLAFGVARVEIPAP